MIRYYLFERISLTILALAFMVHTFIKNGDLRPHGDVFLWICSISGLIICLISLLSLWDDYYRYNELKKWNKQKGKKSWK